MLNALDLGASQGIIRMCVHSTVRQRGGSLTQSVCSLEVACVAGWPRESYFINKLERLNQTILRLPLVPNFMTLGFWWFK